MATDDVRFLLALDHIMTERPEYVYPDEWKDMSGDADGTCQYVIRDGDGGVIGRCLIGEALHEIGVSDSELEVHNSPSFGGDGSLGAWALLTKKLSGLIFISDDVGDLAATVQTDQDNGFRWGFNHDAVKDMIKKKGGVPD